MKNKLFLLIIVCLLIVPTVIAFSRTKLSNVSKITDDIGKIAGSKGYWSNWSGYWMMCHSMDTLQLTNGYEVLQYPYHKPIFVSDILVFVNDTQYTWSNAVGNNIVGRYICVYTGGSNFPEPVEKLDPFQYYIFNAYEDCILLFGYK